MPGSSRPTLDVYKDVFGVDFTPERLEENLSAFGDILNEIKRLRALDLAEVHPVVIFDPTAGYEGVGKP